MNWYGDLVRFIGFMILVMVVMGACLKILLSKKL